MNWTFTPRLTLQAYSSRSMAVGKYDEFKELAQPKTYDYNIYGQGGSTIASDGRRYTGRPGRQRSGRRRSLSGTPIST